MDLIRREDWLPESFQRVIYFLLNRTLPNFTDISVRLGFYRIIKFMFRHLDNSSQSICVSKLINAITMGYERGDDPILIEMMVNHFLTEVNVENLNLEELSEDDLEENLNNLLNMGVSRNFSLEVRIKFYEIIKLILRSRSLKSDIHSQIIEKIVRSIVIVNREKDVDALSIVSLIIQDLEVFLNREDLNQGDITKITNYLLVLLAKDYIIGGMKWKFYNLFKAFFNRDDLFIDTRIAIGRALINFLIKADLDETIRRELFNIFFTFVEEFVGVEDSEDLFKEYENFYLLFKRYELMISSQAVSLEIRQSIVNSFASMDLVDIWGELDEKGQILLISLIMNVLENSGFSMVVRGNVLLKMVLLARSRGNTKEVSSFMLLCFDDLFLNVKNDDLLEDQKKFIKSSQEWLKKSL